MDDGGWLSTRKPGRDDRAIAKAAQKATAARKAKRGGNNKKNTAAAKKKTTSNNKKKGPTTKKQPQKKKKKKNSVMEDLSADEEDIIMEDSEEEEEEEEEEEAILLESEEDEESIFSVADDEDDEAEEELSDAALDEEDEEISFMPKSKRLRNLQVQPMMAQTERRKRAAKIAGNVIVSRSSTSSSNDNDDSDEYISSPEERRKQKNTSSKNLKKPPPPATKRASAPTVNLNESSSEEESDNDNDKRKKPVKSKFFNNKTKQKTGPWNEEEDDDTPVRSKPAGRKRVIALDEGDNENETAAILADDDSVSWEDDDVALKAALRASVKEYSSQDSSNSKGRLKKLGSKKKDKKNNKKKKKSKAQKRNESSSPADGGFLKDSDESEDDDFMEEEKEESEKLVHDLLSSDDEDAGGGDEEDEYLEDAGARQASEALKLANDLSAGVLKNMTSWATALAANDNDNSSNNNTSSSPESKGKMAIPQGMIVDGALAMSSLKRNPSKARSNAGNVSHSWISNQVMKEILPHVTLAEYQLLGVNWLAMLHKMRCKIHDKAVVVNGVLADEMGLGKTCQTIAFLAWLKYSRDGDDESDADEADDEKREAQVIEVDTPDRMPKHAKNPTAKSTGTLSPHLIVVPASVVSNWKREFENFAPNLKVELYHGSMEERVEKQRRLLSCLRKADATLPDVLITSITYFQKESATDRDFLRKITFEYLVVDEAHQLKNARGLRYKHLDRFKTKHRLLLTGTPVQNNPAELMALLCFLMPFFSKQSKQFQDDDGEFDGGQSMLQHFVSLESSNGLVEDSEEVAYRKLKQLFAPFVLRRKKVDVLSQILPAKTYKLAAVELEPRARELYNDIIAQHVQAKKNRKANISDHLFTTLRKAATHPLLLRTRNTSPEAIDFFADLMYKWDAFKGDACTKERIAQEIKEYSDFDVHLHALELSEGSALKRQKLERYILTETDLFESAKFMKLREMLPALIENGHRVLIFSVWTNSLDLLGCLLEHMGLDYRRMDGQTPVAERQERIDEFNRVASIPVFLLSTKACGLGINLTSADTCIMYDIDLNPFNDLQAEDRCHRIGQKNPVTIIKMVSKDTVDWDIYTMQERKKKMNAAIMESSGEWSKQEKSAKAEVMQSVVDRFLTSPKPPPVASKASANVEKENLNNGSQQTKQEVVDLI